MSNGWEWTID